MINLNQLKSLPKIKPELEQQEKLQEYLHSIEQSLIVAWRSGKENVEIECENDVYEGHALKRYLKELGYRVELFRTYDNYYMKMVPEKLKVWFK